MDERDNEPVTYGVLMLALERVRDDLSRGHTPTHDAGMVALGALMRELAELRDFGREPSKPANVRPWPGATNELGK